MSTSPLPSAGKKTNGHWLWLVGGTTFLIALLWSCLIGALLPLSPLHTLGDVIISVFLFLSVPLLLSIFSMLLWRRTGKSGRALTPRGGLRTLGLADLLTIITAVLIVTFSTSLVPLTPPFCSGVGCNRDLGWLVLSFIVVLQTLFPFPFLLLAGALLARRQARSQTRAQ